jgi:hypothetical protein
VSTLPDPPDGHTLWSIVTLAKLLCVAPAAVDALLTAGPTSDDDSPAFRAARVGHFYEVPGMTLGDCWLRDEAAERIAAALPAARLARIILADPDGLDESVQRIAGPALLALAQHVVTHGGSAA